MRQILPLLCSWYSWPPDATTVPPERRVTTYIVFVPVSIGVTLSLPMFVT